MILSIKQTNDLDIYLGAPLLHRRILKHCVSFILDKMKTKSSSWKSKNLSFVGRITLAQSCLCNMPGHIMQSMSIPISVCDEAEAIYRNFI